MSFFRVDGSISYSDKARELRKDEVRIYPINENSSNFNLPKRWFLLNLNDKTVEVFFDKEQYLQILENKHISQSLHSVNKVYNDYKNSMIAPWFPENIKLRIKENNMLKK